MIPRCTTTVHWWDCDLTAQCRRPEGHIGAHWDGVRFFTAEGRQVPQDPASTPVQGVGHPRPCPCEYHVRAREYNRRYQEKQQATA